MDKVAFSMNIEEVILMLKNDVSDFYFHRDANDGQLELNIEFDNTDVAQKLIDDRYVKEFDSCAMWE